MPGWVAALARTVSGALDAHVHGHHLALPRDRGDAGRHFDPACVEAFVSVAEGWETRYAAAHVLYADRRWLG